MVNLIHILLFWFIASNNVVIEHSNYDVSSVDTIKVVHWLNDMNQKFLDEKVFSYKTNISVYRDSKEETLEEKSETSFYRNSNEFVQTRLGQITIEDKKLHLTLDSIKKEITVLDPVGFASYQSDVSLIKSYLKLAESINISDDSKRLRLEFPQGIEVKYIELMLNDKMFLKRMIINYHPQALEENGVSVYHEPFVKIEFNELSSSEKRKITSYKIKDIVSLDSDGKVKSKVAGYIIKDQRKKTKK